MATKRHSQKTAADRLDAHITALDGGSGELGNECGDQVSDDAPALRIADLFHQEAIDLHPDAEFVATLSDRLHAAYKARQPAVATSRPFLARLRDHLTALLITRERRTFAMRLTWGVTIFCAVIATLVAVALLNPRALPADKILANSAAATGRAPGMIEHATLEIQLEKLDGDAATTVSHTFVEDWQRIGDTLDGHLLTVERITARYAVGDSGQRMPLSWAYETWSQHCFLDLSDDPHVYRDPETDAEGCTTMEQIVQLTIPGTVFQAAEAGPQTWAGRLQVNPARIEDQKDTFQGQPVYNLTEQSPDATLTLYVDRKTYLPVGFVAETPEYRLTQIVHTYEVVPPDSFAVDPFAWPPAAIADDDIQPSPGPQDLR